MAKQTVVWVPGHDLLFSFPFYQRATRIKERKFSVCVCDTSQDTNTTTTTDFGKMTIYYVFIGCTGVPWYLMMILGK